MDRQSNVTAAQLVSAMTSGKEISVEIYLREINAHPMVRAKIVTMHPESGNKDSNGAYFNWCVWMEIIQVAGPDTILVPRNMSEERFVRCRHW